MAIAYTSIFSLFIDEFTVLKRGEQHLNSGDIVQFIKCDSHYTLKVRASMKKQEYTVEVWYTTLSNLLCEVCYRITVNRRVQNGFEYS